jgi:hypothetical protein
MTTTCTLDFELSGLSALGPAEPGAPPEGIPIVRFYLKQHSEMKDGTPIISGHLASEAEIDTFVQLLKQDLDAVAERAKAKLSMALSDETRRHG